MDSAHAGVRIAEIEIQASFNWRLAAAWQAVHLTAV
jgi:hypothetical protein